jgi:hypothetical protein
MPKKKTLLVRHVFDNIKLHFREIIRNLRWINLAQVIARRLAVVKICDESVHKQTSSVALSPQAKYTD